MSRTNSILLGIALGIIIVIVATCVSGCATLQSRNSVPPYEAPTPAGQMWDAVKKSNSLTTVAILIIAIGAVALFNGAAKLGMSAVLFGCVTLFMALATARFALWMAIFGMVGAIAAVAVSILARKRALVEVIKGVQEYKVLHSTSTQADMNAILAGEQKTPTTQKIVQDIKTKLKLKGEI